MYFAGRFRYRRASVLAGALLALVCGAAPLAVFAPDWLRAPWSLGVGAGAAFIGLISFVLLFAGFKLLLRWCVGATLMLEISDDGVSYGGRQVAWDEVQWIGGRSVHGRMQLALQRKRPAPELQLLMDEPLSVDRYDALMQELSAALREKHPHVAVG